MHKLDVAKVNDDCITQPELWVRTSSFFKIPKFRNLRTPIVLYGPGEKPTCHACDRLPVSSRAKTKVEITEVDSTKAWNLTLSPCYQGTFCPLFATFTLPFLLTLVHV